MDKRGKAYAGSSSNVAVEPLVALLVSKRTKRGLGLEHGGGIKVRREEKVLVGLHSPRVLQKETRRDGPPQARRVPVDVPAVVVVAAVVSGGGEWRW